MACLPARATADSCTSAINIPDGVQTPCSGVLIPESVAMECAQLQARVDYHDEALAIAKERCHVRVVRAEALMKLERERVKAERDRADSLSVALKKLSKMPPQREVPVWQSAELWGPVGVILGAAVVVAIYEGVVRR